MIDLHSHILPALDDGPPTIDASLELARAAVADGTRVIAATPHVREDYPTTADEMELRLAELRRALAAAAIPLEVLPGAELALDAVTAHPDEELRRLALAGNPAYVLLEVPYYGWPLDFANLVFGLRLRGFTPVLGHPERNPEVQAEPERLRPLAEQGALVQVTAASVDGRLGRRPREAAFALLERGLVHLLASDAHTPDVRAVGLSSAVAAIGDEDLGRWLAQDMPGAVVARERLPERPEPAQRRRGRFLLARRRRGA